MSALGLRLRHKLAISLVIAALLPVLVAYWVGASVVLRGLERGLDVEVEQQLDVGINLLLRDIEQLGHEATRFAASEALIEALAVGDTDQVMDTITLHERYLPQALIQVANRHGEVLGHRASSTDNKRFVGLGVTAESPSVVSGISYERRVTLRSLGRSLVVRATAPIVDDNFDLLGVVVLSSPLDGLFADRMKASLGTDVLLIEGNDFSGSPMLSFLDPLGGRLDTWKMTPSLVKEVKSGRNSYEDRRVLGGVYGIGYTPIHDLEGRIVGAFGVAVDRAPVSDARNSSTRSLALGAFGAFVFAFGLAGLLSRRITRPLQNLHHGALAIARGDLDHTISVPEGDEIGDLAQAFSHMTGALKENQRRLAARMREIVALHDAGRAVSSVIETDQVLRKVVDSVARVLHLRVCTLWLVGEGQEMHLGAARAKRHDMRTVSDLNEVEQLVAPLLHIARSVASSRGTLRVDDVKEHSGFGAHASKAGVDGSLIASVLERKGSVVGVIIVGRGANARPFSDADENLLSTFADQAATAIENATLYAKVRRFNEELEMKVQLRTTELQAINNELGLTISELKETQAQLLLSERLAGLGQLVAGVAHEINSPSAAIRGTADTLSDTVTRLSTRQTRLRDVFEDGDKATALVRLFEEVAPNLAEKRRVPPAQVLRNSRALSSVLQDGKVDSSVAKALGKPLAELGVDEGLAAELAPYLQLSEDDARFVADFMTDYVFVHRSTRTIQDAIRRIQRIVGALKGYSHLDQDESRLPTDIHEGIENTLVILEHQLGHGITVERRYAALPAVPVYVDELNQVWTNLIHNAVQALQGEGQITIETEAQKDGIVVKIIDNGPGIPGDVMERIFEPFFTTKAKGEGTGLGLGIVRQIVEKHLGKVSCESRAGHTEFTVWLPIQPVANPEPDDQGVQS